MYEKSLYTKSVINKQGTNHKGEIKSSWWPVKNGITNSLYKLTGAPQNFPINGATIIVMPKYKMAYKMYGTIRLLKRRLKYSKKPYLLLKRIPEIKKNSITWNEYGGNIGIKENSRCPETTIKIASAFNKLILLLKTLSKLSSKHPVDTTLI